MKEIREKLDTILARLNSIEEDLGNMLEQDLPSDLEKLILESLEKLELVWDRFFGVVEQALEEEE